MPHEPGHRNTSYKIVGTDEPYNGNVVMVGDLIYTTVGGGVEGNRQQVVSMGNGNTSQTQTQNDNPVTETFVSTTIYYRQDGTTVPAGADIHRHADGTEMLGHDPNNMGAIVTKSRPSQRRATTRTTRTTRNQTQRTRTSTGGSMGGGGTTGGGGY